MNITVLDAKPLDAGDIDWSPIRELGTLTLHDNTFPEEVRERVSNADVIFSNKVKLPQAVFKAAPNLKMIGVLATGYDIIDLEAARAHNVVVCNVPSYSRAFTAQTAIALLLELCHRAGAHSDAVKGGHWASQSYFSFWNYPLFELDGKTLVVLGLGNIGRRVAKIAKAFGMKVIAAQLPGRDAGDDAEIPYLPLEEAIAQADVISLHCPATPQTRSLVNAKFLSRLKPGVLLVNASRGALVNDAELAAALSAGQIAGYAADVLTQEPPSAGNPLLSAPNCILTPHIGWASPDCRQKILSVSVENLKAFLNGSPQNVVS
jgi:glycerate dehydrogenase